MNIHCSLFDLFSSYLIWLSMESSVCRWFWPFQDETSICGHSSHRSWLLWNELGNGCGSRRKFITKMDSQNENSVCALLSHIWGYINWLKRLPFTCGCIQKIENVIFSHDDDASVGSFSKILMAVCWIISFRCRLSSFCHNRAALRKIYISIIRLMCFFSHCKKKCEFAVSIKLNQNGVFMHCMMEMVGPSDFRENLPMLRTAHSISRNMLVSNKQASTWSYKILVGGATLVSALPQYGIHTHTCARVRVPIQ